MAFKATKVCHLLQQGAAEDAQHSIAVPVKQLGNGQKELPS